MMLLAASSNWLGSWVTPLWMIGVGVLFGLAALVLLWLLAAAASNISGIGKLAENRSVANQVAAGIALLTFVLALVLGPTIVPNNDGTSWLSGENAIVNVFVVGLISALIGLSLVYLTSRRAVNEVVDAVREGPMWPIFLTAAGLATFGVIGFFVATTPREILKSVGRFTVAGQRTWSFTIPAAPREELDNPAKDPPQHPVSVSFRPQEVRQLVFRSDQNVTIDLKETGDLDDNPMVRANSGQELIWMRTKENSLPTTNELVSNMYVRNFGTADAHLTLTVTSAPEHPEVNSIVLTALATVVVFLMYFLQRALMPKLSAVSLASFKSEIAQPLFLIVMAIGLASIFAFIWIPYNTLGEDIKVLKDTGMTTIMVLSIIQAIWAASTSIADEIEGKTALTVLSKPINRRSFIVGKFLGIFWTVGVIFVILSVAFLVAVAYKPIYDNREGSYKPQYPDQVASSEDVTWQQCHYEMVGVVPGLVLAFMETVVLTALSVAISTRLPMLANFVITFSIYVLGHLTPLIVQSSVGKFAPVRFVAELLSTVLPILDHFNIQAAVSTGATVPFDYLGWTLLYSCLYGVIALLLALVLFEDRDLA